MHYQVLSNVYYNTLLSDLVQLPVQFMHYNTFLADLPVTCSFMHYIKIIQFKNRCWQCYIYTLPAHLPVQFMHLPGTYYNIHLPAVWDTRYICSYQFTLFRNPASNLFTLCIYINIIQLKNSCWQCYIYTLPTHLPVHYTFTGYLLQYAFTDCMVHANECITRLWGG